MLWFWFFYLFNEIYLFYEIFSFCEKYLGFKLHYMVGMYLWFIVATDQIFILSLSENYFANKEIIFF